MFRHVGCYAESTCPVALFKYGIQILEHNIFIYIYKNIQAILINFNLAKNTMEHKPVHPPVTVEEANQRGDSTTPGILEVYIP